MKLKGKILAIAVAPTLILALIVCVFSSKQVSASMKEEVKQALQSTVYLEAEAISNSDGEDHFSVDENAILWNGDVNITDDTATIDAIKAGTGIVVTVFYGDTRYMTSVTNATGDRVVGTQAGEKVINTVLKGGEEYFAENVDVVGSPYYAYYIPLYNTGESEPVGMVFAGKSEAVVDSAISSVIRGMVIVAVIMSVIAIAFALYIATSLSKRFGWGCATLEKVASGDLTVEIDEKLLKQKDESGDIARSIKDLKEKLVGMVSTIAQHSNNVNSYANQIGSESSDTSDNIEQVERAVNEVALGATSQAGDTAKATDNVIEMGNLVEQTNENVKALSIVSDEIEESGRVAATNLVELEKISDKTKEAISVIYDQTVTTNESAKQITEAINLITSIASETNLLSLNASIEAARAGEQGRGFAVVASQISKLAEQSNDSARKIEQIATGLMAESEKAVETMDEVNGIIGQQNEMVAKSAECFKEVLSGIEKSREHIGEISQNMDGLNASRETVVDLVSNLSAIAEENAASTQQTSASTSAVRSIVTQMAENAGELQGIAGDLEESVMAFKI